MLAPNQLMYQQKRYRGKINVRNPRIYFKKAVLNELLQPFITDPNKEKTLEQFCEESNVRKTKRELNPYEIILSREVRNWFEQSKMIAIIHVNSIKELDKFDIRVLLHRQNMHYKQYGSQLVIAAIENSPFQGITPLLSKQTAYVFCSDINVAALQKILKKSKKMYLIGGFLEGQLLKVDKFLKYGEMDITAAHLSLVQILQNVGVSLNQQLTHHQSTLVTRLKQIGTKEIATSPTDDEKSVPV